MTIFLTGGAGYIGSAVARALLRQGHRVLVYDNLSTGVRDSVPEGAKFIFGDIRDRELIPLIFRMEKVEAVVHMAAKLVVPESVRDPISYYDVNVMGTLNLLRAASRQGVHRFLFSSTGAVYGEPKKVPVREVDPPSPVSPYGASKAMGEELLSFASKSNGISAVVLRYFNVAGATEDGQVGERGEHVHLVRAAARTALGLQKTLRIQGTDFETADGTGVRDYLHLEDLVDLHLKALDYLERGGTSATFNCGYGRGFSVREVHAMMEKVVGKTIPTESAPRRPGDPAQIFGDPSLVSRVFGWSPRFADLEAICRSTYEWEKSRLV